MPSGIMKLDYGPHNNFCGSLSTRIMSCGLQICGLFDHAKARYQNRDTRTVGMYMHEPLPTSGRLPSHLKVKYGPVGLLGRFFLWADTAAKDRGVTLFFATLQDLVQANKANSDSWRPLFPVFDPALGRITPETGFVIIGRDKEGQVVATQAARLYDWSDTTLKHEATSLRMFYADPDAALARGDRCEILAPAAKTITGRVVFSGAGWYRRDFRSKGLATILPRISRAYAFTRWNTDFTISIMTDAVVAGGMAERCGYTKVEHSSVEVVASPIGVVLGALVWMPADQLLTDLAAMMDQASISLAAPGLAEQAASLTSQGGCGREQKGLPRGLEGSVKGCSVESIELSRPEINGAVDN
jgi:predicted nucleic acid-binding Zn ribbon protein